MIKIYESTERLFNHNGIKIVHPLKADVTKIDNGDYYAEIEDTIENVAFYQQDAIVRIPTPWGEQAFRISNPIINGNRLEWKAWHVSYDAKNYIVKSANAVNKNCNDALDHFNQRTDVTSPFTTTSDIAMESTIYIVRKSLLEVFGEVAEHYNGHFDRNNFTFGIKDKIGQDRGVVLKVGKNITEMKKTEIWDEVCTKILPYTVSSNNTVIELDETYVELPGVYDVPYTRIVEFNNDFKAENYATYDEYVVAVKSWLKGQAEAYLDKHKFPQVNYVVSAEIDNVSDVGDVIQVRHPRCNIDITTEVISIRYDAIMGRYAKIEFGNFKQELKNLVQNITSEANKHTDEVVKTTETNLTLKLDEATAKINGVLGNSYAIYEGDKILVVDALPKETAKRVLKISNGGIGFSSTGINGTFTSAWTLDGTLDMQAINVINMTASLIKGGILKLGGFDNANGKFELYDANNYLIAKMTNEGLTVYAKNGDYVKLNAEEGFVGYNSKNNRTYWADGETFHMRNAEVEDQISLSGKIKIVPVDNQDNVGIGFVALD